MKCPEREDTYGYRDGVGSSSADVGAIDDEFCAEVTMLGVLKRGEEAPVGPVVSVSVPDWGLILSRE